jgi:hypothetical protein
MELAVFNKTGKETGRKVELMDTIISQKNVMRFQAAHARLRSKKGPAEHAPAV